MGAVCQAAAVERRGHGGISMRGNSRRQNTKISSSGGALKISMRQGELSAKFSFGTEAAARTSAMQASNGTERRAYTHQRARRWRS